MLINADLARVCAVISVWDLRSKNNIDADVNRLAAWDTLSYLDPCAEIEYDPPKSLSIMGAWDKFHACVSISTKGTKVVIGGIEEIYDTLPFTVFDCTYQGEVDVIGADRRLEKETRRPCKDLKESSGHGTFHRVDPTKFDINDDNDNERFVIFNGFFFESLRGRYFACTGDPGVVSIWDMEDGHPVSNIFIDTDMNPIYAVLSPDGTKVAISVKKTVQIYETPTGILLGTYDKGLRLDNNSEVVLGNEYFVVRDESLTPPGEPTRARSVVRINDMKVIKSYSLHEDYQISYPSASLTRIAAYMQGSVLNIRRMKGIETPRVLLLCGRRPCDPKEVVIEDFIDKRPFKFTSDEGEVFHGKCYREYHNGCWNMMLKITFSVDLHDPSIDSTPTPKSMVLPLGDMTANFQGFYLPMPSKLVVFAEGYIKIWTLSSKTAQICQLDYVWGSLPYEPHHLGDYCYRPLVKAWACPHGTSMRFYLKKPVWYKNHIVVSGDPESEEYDILTVPPHQEGETVNTEETERLHCGIFSLIDTYGISDSDCKADIVRYFMANVQPSKACKTSCLVPLCEAWSTKNQEYLTELVAAILPEKNDTWIPDSKVATTSDPLAIFLNKAGRRQAFHRLAKVIVNYCIAQATRRGSMVFLFPIFNSMDNIMRYYPAEALKCMGCIAYIPGKHPDYIWKNNITCRELAPLRFLGIEKIRHVFMSNEAKRKTLFSPIMQFKYNMKKTAQDVKDNHEEPVFMASFDALWSYIRKDQSFSKPLVIKPTWWKFLFNMLQFKLLPHSRRTVVCHDFNLEFFDNPAINALVTYKWETIGFPYWLLRFFCQFMYYALVVTAALVQVYSPHPSRLYRVFIVIIAMGTIFVVLQIFQMVQNWKCYLEPYYNIVGKIIYTLPAVASGIQIYYIREQDLFTSNRLLSFSVLIVFFHMLFELRVIRGVCKYVTIIQHALIEIWAFFVIFAGGRYDPVALELDANGNEDWAFHMTMFIFLFLTTILLLNVLIALINVAFGKGGDGWRKAWVEARLRDIEAAENLSYIIPGFRQTYAEWFPKEIYFTTTAKKASVYMDKYPRGRRQDDIHALVNDWNKSENYHGDKDKNKEEIEEERRVLAPVPNYPRSNTPPNVDLNLDSTTTTSAINILSRQMEDVLRRVQESQKQAEQNQQQNQQQNEQNQQQMQSNQTFSAADAARHLSQEHVSRASQEMFRKVADYIRAEMLATGEDYKLLENMNIVTKDRYSELAGVAQELMQEVGKLRTTYSDFEPYLERIDEISQQAETISNIAAELDEYTKSLELRLKRISK
ncbi:biogenesis of lysosome- organelles complex 1 subunit 2 [Linnemannia zychae]|nr:biogenesis of lysosome- organelles complex 1 subunit 2 [Linnemannia zychae]